MIVSLVLDFVRSWVTRCHPLECTLYIHKNNFFHHLSTKNNALRKQKKQLHLTHRTRHVITAHCEISCLLMIFEGYLTSITVTVFRVDLGIVQFSYPRFESNLQSISHTRRVPSQFRGQRFHVNLTMCETVVRKSCLALFLN